MRRHLLFKLLKKLHCPWRDPRSPSWSFLHLHTLVPSSSLIHRIYESHCNLWQSLLQLHQPPFVFFPAHYVVIAPFSLPVSSVSVGYRSDSLLWDKLSPHWSSLPHHTTSFFPLLLHATLPASLVCGCLPSPTAGHCYTVLPRLCLISHRTAAWWECEDVKRNREDMQQRKMTTQRREKQEEENKRRVKVADWERSKEKWWRRDKM